MKHLILDPENDEREIEIPNYIINKINLDYLQRTYYWSIGILCFIIGFLVGIIA